MRAKQILRAGLKKEILFQTQEDFDNHLSYLKLRKRQYKVLQKYKAPDGTVTVTIVESYNDVKLLPN